jgi:prepilin-type processing-associated H-X9-DG protein
MKIKTSNWIHSVTTHPLWSAFTFVELLVVIGVFGFLIVLSMAGMSHAKTESTRAQCMSHLRQFYTACQMYADANDDRLPDVNAGGGWPIDMSVGASRSIEKYGAGRRIQYCPTIPDEDIAYLYDYASYRELGYALTLPNSGRVLPSNINQRISVPSPITISNHVVIPIPSRRELLCDIIISVGQSNFTRVPGGWIKPHQTSHLYGSIPAGGNIAFLDGHVEWRKWGPEVIVRTYAEPSFWW